MTKPVEPTRRPQARIVMEPVVEQPLDSSPRRLQEEPPAVEPSPDDILGGATTPEAWACRRDVLKRRFLDLIRDDEKPERPPIILEVHEVVGVEGIYECRLVSYSVEADERAHAYIGVPLQRGGSLPGIVALHGTYPQGKALTAGLVGNPEMAYLDHLCRRGYVVIAPDHFVAGHRTPPEGPYETARFYKRHPEWTAVGKFTYEHSIALDVLESLDQVDAENLGCLGHSLGGQGTTFLTAYDERVKAAACNCSAQCFRYNPRVLEWARDRWYVYFRHLRPLLLEGRLPPIDFHEMMALAAPRAFLDLSGLNDGPALSQRQRITMLMRVFDVYDLLGVPERFAFYAHGRGHSVAHESRQLMYGWMDAHLKPSKATQARLVGEPIPARHPADRPED